MRELKRSIARAHMEAAGVKRINKRIYPVGPRSAFAEYWRWFLVYDPTDKKRNKKNRALLQRIETAIRKRRARLADAA